MWADAAITGTTSVAVVAKHAKPLRHAVLIKPPYRVSILRFAAMLVSVVVDVIDGEEDRFSFAAACTDVSAVVRVNDVLDFGFSSSLVRLLPFAVWRSRLSVRDSPLCIPSQDALTVALIAFRIQALAARSTGEPVITIECRKRQAIAAHLAPLDRFAFRANALCGECFDRLVLPALRTGASDSSLRLCRFVLAGFAASGMAVTIS